MSFNLAHQLAARTGDFDIPDVNPGRVNAEAELNRNREQQRLQLANFRKQQEQTAQQGIEEEKQRQQQRKQAQLQSYQEMQQGRRDQAQELQNTRKKQAQETRREGRSDVVRGAAKQAGGRAMQAAGKGMQTAGKGVTKAGSAAGQAVGGAGGAAVGGTVGAVGGAVGGAITGALAGGVGAIPGALAGAQAGASAGVKTGAKVGGTVGKQAGKAPGKAMEASGKSAQLGGRLLRSSGKKQTQKGAKTYISGLSSRKGLPGGMPDVKGMVSDLKSKAGKTLKTAKAIASGDAKEGIKEASRWSLTSFWGSVWMDWTFLSLLYLHAHLAASAVAPSVVCQFGEDYFFGKWIPEGWSKWTEIIILFLIDATILVIVLTISFIVYKLWNLGGWGWFMSWLGAAGDATTIGNALIRTSKDL